MNFVKANQDKFLFAFLIGLFLTFSFFILYRLGVHPYIDWDESIYAQVAKEAFLNHRFFDLSYYGVDWFEKPPLMFWLISMSYAIGGVSELTTRIPSALASIGMVLISLRWVWEIRKTYTALLMTMACYFIMFPFLTASYFVNLDTIVGFFAVGATYSWWKARMDSNLNQSRKWFLIWGISIGLGVLSKNIIGLFPLVPIVAYELIHKDLKFLKNREFWLGVLASLVIALPWHIYQSVLHGKTFWNNYLLYHVLQRYSTSLEGNGAPFLYYFEIIFQRYPIALVVFGSGVLVSIHTAWKNKSVRYVLISAVVLFLLFSSSTTKLYSYIIIVLPLIVMLAGITIAELISFIPKQWMRLSIMFVLIVTFAYTGFSFNSYKLAQGEYSLEHTSNKNTGEFLKDFRTELPIYINQEYRNLAIGYYSERVIIPTTDQIIMEEAKELMFHQPFQHVLLGKDSQGKEYLLIKRQAP